MDSAAPLAPPTAALAPPPPLPGPLRHQHRVVPLAARRALGRGLAECIVVREAVEPGGRGRTAMALPNLRPSSVVGPGDVGVHLCIGLTHALDFGLLSCAPSPPPNKRQTRRSEGGGGGLLPRPRQRPRQQPAHTPIRQLLGAADAQTAHPATSSTAPTHQSLGSANAETTPARAPAAAADRTQRPDATCEGKNG